MPAPAYSGAGVGEVDTTGAWTATGAAGAAGDFLILQVLDDGNFGTATVDSGTNVNNLAGSAGVWTFFGQWGSGVCSQQIWFGRATGTSAPTATGSNADGGDLYFRIYRFTGVHDGATVADVLEQNGTTTPATSSGTSATVTDAGVITTGADRLALNLVVVNDDNAMGAFTGMTGGTWAEAVAEFASATGTDGCIQLQTATMASAGTINGGSYVMVASDNFLSLGFALKPVIPPPTEAENRERLQMLKQMAHPLPHTNFGRS